MTDAAHNRVSVSPNELVGAPQSGSRTSFGSGGGGKSNPRPILTEPLGGRPGRRSLVVTRSPWWMTTRSSTSISLF